MILTEDIAKTILAGCYKFGAATMLRENGATMTKVIEVYEEEILRSEQEQGQEWKDSKARVQGLHNVHPRFGRGGVERRCGCLWQKSKKMIDKIILEQFYLNRPCRF